MIIQLTSTHRFKQQETTGVVWRQRLGIACQMIPLMFLPVLIPLQLAFGIPLVVMPFSILCGLLLFTIGYILRGGQA